MALTKIKTSGIADNAITNAKMADDAIDSADFADASIDNVHVATGLDAVKLADGTVTNTEFQYINTLSSNAQTQISAALPKAGGAMTGAITTNSTFDGVDIATRDAILTSTTTTAGAALPKAGGTMTGALLGSNGSASAPSHSFSANTDSGMYSPADNQLGLASGGTLALIFGGDQSATFSSDVEVGGTLYAPQYIKHSGDTDTYIQFQADRTTLVAGGVEFVDYYEGAQNYISLGGSSDTDTRLQGGAGYIFIQGSDGAIGINDASPSYPFEVNAITNFTSDVSFANDIFIGGIAQTDSSSYKKLYLPSHAEISSIGGADGSFHISQNAYVHTGNDSYYKSSDEASTIQQYNGLINFAVSNGVGTAGAQVSWQSALTITNSGDVGIGTTTPNVISGWTQSTSAINILNVYSSSAGARIAAQGADASLDLVDIGATSGRRWWSIYNNADKAYMRTLADDGSAVGFDLLTFDLANGNVGIGDTNPGQLLSVTTNIDDEYVTAFLNAHSGGYGALIRGGDIALNVQDHSGTSRFRVRGNGDVIMPIMYSNNVGGDTFRNLNIRNDGLLGVNTSSKRYKKNIKDLSDISWIYDLRPVDFEWKETGKKDWGLIAEEVLEVQPSIVGIADGVAEWVDYEKLTPILLKAIKELNAKVTALENA
jgi:hypothetical protein